MRASSPMPLSPGARAPDFVLNNTDEADGSAVRLSQLCGRIVILVFFSTEWDAAKKEVCRQYQQVLSEFAVTLSNADASLILNSCEQAENIAGQYGVEGRNAFFIVGEDGFIHWVHVEAEELPPPERMRAALQALYRMGSTFPAEMEYGLRNDPARFFTKKAAAVCILPTRSSARAARFRSKRIRDVPFHHKLM